MGDRRTGNPWIYLSPHRSLSIFNENHIMAPLEIFSISVSIGKEKCSRHPANLIRRDLDWYTHHKQHYSPCDFGKYEKNFQCLVLFMVCIPTRNPAYQVRCVSRTLLVANTHRNTEDFRGRHNLIFVENTKATVRGYVYPPNSGTAVDHSYLVFLA